jgi:hypothetical protein
MKKFKRFLIALTAVITIPVVYLFGPGPEPTGVAKLSDFSMVGDFQILNGVRDSVDTNRLLLPLDSLIDEGVQAYCPGSGGDIFCRGIPTDIGKTYRFSVSLLSGGVTSNIQFHDGRKTFLTLENLVPGKIEQEFVAPSNSLQISISYGPSAWSNVLLEVETE